MIPNPLEIYILIYYRINKFDCFAVLIALCFWHSSAISQKFNKKFFEVPANFQEPLKHCVFLVCERLQRLNILLMLNGRIETLTYSNFFM